MNLFFFFFAFHHIFVFVVFFFFFFERSLCFTPTASQNAQNHELCRNTLDNLLIKPVQRICKVLSLSLSISCSLSLFGDKR